MNSDRGMGASPGPADNANPTVQTGQPNSQNDLNSGQPGTPNLELLYQLSAEDRAAIMALPPAQRDPAVAALNQARVDFENGMQERLEEGRQAITNMNALYADPRFQDFLIGTNDQQQPPNPAPNPNPPANNFGGLYETPEQERQANAIFDNMAERIGEKLNIAGLNSTLQNLQRGMLQNEQERGWDTLVEYTKENNLPDPNSIKSQIYMMMRDNPNMKLDQAYSANVDLRALATRPPITDTGGNPDIKDGENNSNLPAPTQMPGTSKSSAVPDTKTEIVDPVEAAYARAEKGERIDPENGFKDSFSESIAAYNAEHGTNFEPDNFQIG